MVDQNQFDLSQLSDIVSRNKISDKRKRNEMIRLGTSDPNSFAMQNQQQIQEAQQPSEFWGAGRKIGANQNPDINAANLVGGLYNLGGVYNYYGDKDTSTAQFGTKGYTTKDLGGGKFDVLDQTGTSLGQSFGTVADAINAYRKNQYQLDKAAYDKYSAELAENPVYDSEGGLITAPAPVYHPYQARAGGFGALEDWEVLGQLLNGKLGGIFSNANPLTNFTKSTRRYIPGNNQVENVSGLNTLFGSTPLIWDNKVQGYVMDPTPADPSTVGYMNPYSVGRFDNSGKTRSAAQLSREYTNPEEWAKLGKSLDENRFYVPAENAASLPGWSQKDYQAYSKASSSGLFGSAFKILDPILDKVDPLHDRTQNHVVDLLGADSQQAAFETVAPIVASFFGGWGALANTANSASKGDMTGTILSALSGASQFAGVGTPTSYLGDQFKSMGLSPTLAKAAANFTTSALTNAARGGDLKSSLGSALFSTAGGAAGDALSKATQGALGDVGSKMLGGAASGGIGSLFSKNSPIAGSLYGAMSGGLHGFLNSTSKTGDQFNKKEDDENRMKAQALARLFKKPIYDKVK